jgi:DNA-binding response OmpR family regulator
MLCSNDRVRRLEELCTSAAAAKVMDRIINRCEGSPRTLLRLCQLLLRSHVERTDETLIDSVDVTEALLEFDHQMEAEQRPVWTEDPQNGESPSETTVHLDSSGHVWIMGERLQPPLSDKEFKLLQSLYRVAPDIVPHADLIETLWPRSTWDLDDAYSEQNLRKLVSRLRKRLDGVLPGGMQNPIRSTRGRGYWLKK